MLERLKRGEVAREVRLLAARGVAQAPASELLSILVWLTRDEDDEIRRTAAGTLAQLPKDAIRQFLGGVVLTDDVRAYFEPVGGPVAAGGGGADAAVSDTAGADLQAEPEDDDPDLVSDAGATDRDGILRKLSKMTFPQRLKAAAKGSREVRAILIRDPSKVVAMAVLTSPKLTEPEVEAFARMGNVAEDVLRHIGTNRAWMKNYAIVLALAKNAKTPLGLSLNLMSRLNERDVQGLSTDRNVPEPLRVAARKKVTAAASSR